MSNNCKRCGKELRSAESIKRGMGKTCWRISQLQQVKQPEVKPEINQEIAFLKCEIKTLKRMIKNIQINGSRAKPIERIKFDRPEQKIGMNKSNFGSVLSEMKEMFNSVENVYDLLCPINARTSIEAPPILA